MLCVSATAVTTSVPHGMYTGCATLSALALVTHTEPPAPPKCSTETRNDEPATGWSASPENTHPPGLTVAVASPKQPLSAHLTRDSLSAATH